MLNHRLSTLLQQQNYLIYHANKVTLRGKANYFLLLTNHNKITIKCKQRKLKMQLKNIRRLKGPHHPVSQEHSNPILLMLKTCKILSSWIT